jgi:Leucine-rich repeat (LRR) protein
MLIIRWVKTISSSKQDVASIISGSLDQYYYTGLDYLKLSEQGLTTIPDICTELSTEYQKRLLVLDLAANDLTWLDMDLSCLPNIQELNISYNNLTSLDGIQDIAPLQTLTAHKNQLTDITAIASQDKLVSVNLWFNKITDIGVLSKLQQAQTILLNANLLTDVSALDWLDTLVTLRLEFNDLMTEAVQDIIALPNIKFLTMAGNKIDQALVDKRNNKSLLFQEGQE